MSLQSNHYVATHEMRKHIWKKNSGSQTYETEKNSIRMCLVDTKTMNIATKHETFPNKMFISIVKDREKEIEFNGPQRMVKSIKSHVSNVSYCVTYIFYVYKYAVDRTQCKLLHSFITRFTQTQTNARSIIGEAVKLSAVKHSIEMQRCE